MARMGLRIPEDVAFVDLFLSEPSTETAGMRHNFSTVGAVAIEILAGQMRQNIRGIPEIPTTTFVEGTWFDGPSCPFPQRRARKLA
jgi:LacI family transcriptional regulator